MILGPTGEPWRETRPVPLPTDEEVDHYVRLRRAARVLNGRLTATVPRKAMDETGRALGIVRDGVRVFDSEVTTDLLTDCCLYDWTRNGMNLVQRFADEHPPPDGTDEREVLDAMLLARYALFGVEEAFPGKGVRAVSLVDEREIFVIDMGLSRTPGVERAALASRIMPVGAHWMTSGTALPLDAEAWDSFTRTIARRVLPASEFDPVGDPEMVLALVRSCIEAGATDRVRYQYEHGAVGPRAAALAGRRARGPARPRRTSRNAPCPCGSGQKYKRCCGLRGPQAALSRQSKGGKGSLSRRPA